MKQRLEKLKKVSRLTFFFACFWVLTGVTSCSDEFGCSINGHNLSGRINYTGAVSLAAGLNIYVQTSITNFIGPNVGQAIVNNGQGVPSIPYSICAPTDLNFQIQAFVDSNGSGSYESGEPIGRVDGTSTGHASYLNLFIPDEENRWKTIGAVDLDLDVQ